MTKTSGETLLEEAVGAIRSIRNTPDNRIMGRRLINRALKTLEEEGTSIPSSFDIDVGSNGNMDVFFSTHMKG